MLDGIPNCSSYMPACKITVTYLTRSYRWHLQIQYTDASYRNLHTHMYSISKCSMYLVLCVVRVPAVAGGAIIN